MAFPLFAGVSLGGSYNVISPVPLDNRSVVADATDRASLVTNHIAYPGMIVFQMDTEETWQLAADGINWTQFGLNSSGSGVFGDVPNLKATANGTLVTTTLNSTTITQYGGFNLFTQADVGRYINTNKQSLYFDPDTKITAVATNGLTATINRAANASTGVRTDTGCVMTAGSKIVLDSTVTQADVGKKVANVSPNIDIQTGSYIISVVDNTSFTMNLQAATSNTASLVIGETFALIQIGTWIIPDRYALRSNSLFLGHYTYVPRDDTLDPLTSAGDEFDSVADSLVVNHFLDHTVNSQASSVIAGPRGLHNTEGLIVFGPNHAPMDCAGGPGYNIATAYTNQAEQTVSPGGLITAMVDSSQISGSGHGKYNVYGQQSYWSNKLFTSYGFGELHVGEIIDYISANVFQVTPVGNALGLGIATTIGRWTGFGAGMPGMIGGGGFTPLTFGRAIGFDAGQGRTRDIVGVNSLDGTNIINTDTVQFTDQDVGASITHIIPPPWSSTTTYPAYAPGGTVISSFGRIYKSLQNGNLNHPPSTSPTFWQNLGIIPIRGSIRSVQSSTQVIVNMTLPDIIGGTMTISDSELDPFGGPAYSSSHLYAEGDVVQYQGYTWECAGIDVPTFNKTPSYLTPYWVAVHTLPLSAGFRSASPIVLTSPYLQEVADLLVISVVAGVNEVRSRQDVTLNNPPFDASTLLNGSIFTITNKGDFNITIPATGITHQSCTMGPNESSTWRYIRGLFGGFYLLSSTASSSSGSFVQDFTQTDVLTGNQAEPIHLQVNQIVDYPGPIAGIFGPTPDTSQHFVATTWDGNPLHGYPHVMQGPSGWFQLDGSLTFNFDAGGIGQTAALIQTAPTIKNGPRIRTVTLTHNTNVVTCTGEFDALDTGAIFQATTLVGGSVTGIPTAPIILTYVSANNATMSGTFTGTTGSYTGYIWRQLNIAGSALINNSPSYIADTQEVGMSGQLTITAPGIQDGYANPPGVYGITDDQYFGSVNKGWLNLSNSTRISAADGGYIATAPNISTVTDFFLPEYVGWIITSNKTGISTGTRILSVTDSKNAVLTKDVTQTQSGAKLTLSSGGSDRVSVGFWSLPVWHGKVNMAARYDIFLSEAYMADDLDGNSPILEKHVGLYHQSSRLATQNLSFVINSPFQMYDVDTTYTSPMFGDLGTSVFGGALFSLENDYTLDFAGATMGAMFQNTSTVQYKHDASAYGAGVLMQHLGTYKNARRITNADGFTQSGIPVIASASGKFLAGDVGIFINGTGLGVGVLATAFNESVTTTVAAGSIGASTGTLTSLQLISTAGMTTSGFIVLPKPNSFSSAVISYTGISSNTLTGCSLINGVTFTIAAPQNAIYPDSLTISSNATVTSVTNTFTLTALNIDLGALSGISLQYTVQADAASVNSGTTAGTTDFRSAANYEAINGGTLGFNGHTSFISQLSIGDRTSGFARVGYRYNDIVLSGTGSAAAQFGIIIDPLVGANTNIGISNASTTVEPPGSLQVPNATTPIQPTSSYIEIAPTSSFTFTGTIFGPGVGGGQVIDILNASNFTVTYPALHGAILPVGVSSVQQLPQQIIQFRRSSKYGTWILRQGNNASLSAINSGLQFWTNPTVSTNGLFDPAGIYATSTLTQGASLYGFGTFVKFAPTIKMSASPSFVGGVTFQNAMTLTNTPTAGITYAPTRTLYDQSTFSVDTKTTGTVGSSHATVDSDLRVQSIHGGIFNTPWDMYGMVSRLTVNASSGVGNRYAFRAYNASVTPTTSSTPSQNFVPVYLGADPQDVTKFIVQAPSPYFLQAGLGTDAVSITDFLSIIGAGHTITAVRTGGNVAEISGTPPSRNVSTIVMGAGFAAISASTAVFTTADIGSVVTHVNFPTGTTIIGLGSTVGGGTSPNTTALLSNEPTGNTASATIVVYKNSSKGDDLVTVTGPTTTFVGGSLGNQYGFYADDFGSTATGQNYGFYNAGASYFGGLTINNTGDVTTLGRVVAVGLVNGGTVRVPFASKAAGSGTYVTTQNDVFIKTSVVGNAITLGDLAVGTTQTIFNATAGNITIHVPTGGKMNDGAVDSTGTIATKVGKTYTCDGAKNWYQNS